MKKQLFSKQVVGKEWHRFTFFANLFNLQLNKRNLDSHQFLKLVFLFVFTLCGSEKYDC